MNDDLSYINGSIVFSGFQAFSMAAPNAICILLKVCAPCSIPIKIINEFETNFIFNFPEGRRVKEATKTAECRLLEFVLVCALVETVILQL